MNLHASCLCGAVRVEVDGGLERAPQACHCTQCRKQTGHYLVAVNVRREKLNIHGEDKLTWFRSSENIERGFCSVCGSTLFWRPEIEGYEYLSIAMGAFDEPTGARISKHIFVADKGDYYDIDDGLPQSDAY